MRGGIISKSFCKPSGKAVDLSNIPLISRDVSFNWIAFRSRRACDTFSSPTKYRFTCLVGDIGCLCKWKTAARTPLPCSADRSYTSTGESASEEGANVSKSSLRNEHHSISRSSAKQRVVILGTGWSSFNFLKMLDKQSYEIFVVSPRNYFAFTPLLPSVCSGTLSPNSCIEPIRKHMHVKDKIDGEFYEARCVDTDVINKAIVCEDESGSRFRLSYDYLVIGIGATTNTFGIKGVEEYAFFLKEVDHALQIRRKVIINFELASLPGVSPAERNRLLHFAVVGGGPTGVEVAAEISDFIREDLNKSFPTLGNLAKVTLIEMTSRLLPMFPHDISEFTEDMFSNRLGVQVMMEHAVTEIAQYHIKVKNLKADKNEALIELPYGFVLWASGVGQVPLAKTILSKIEQQSGNRVLAVNPQFKVIGADDMYAFGDCSFMVPPSLKQSAEELFHQSGGKVVAEEWIKQHAPRLMHTFPQLSPLKCSNVLHPKVPMSIDDFRAYAAEIDLEYRPPAPTAQNARQAGFYLANVFNEFTTADAKREAPAFVETWNGSLAYIGGNQAVAYLPYFNILGGVVSLPFWKVVYVQMLSSWKSRFSCCYDCAAIAIPVM